MFAVVNHLHFTKPAAEFQAPIQDAGLPLLQSLPGFRDFYFVKEGENEAVVIIIWDTPTDAQNGAQVFGPTWFAQNLAPHLASEQRRSVGPVLVSHKL